MTSVRALLAHLEQVNVPRVSVGNRAERGLKRQLLLTGVGPGGFGSADAEDLEGGSLSDEAAEGFEIEGVGEHEDIGAVAVRVERRPHKDAPIRTLLGYLIRETLRGWLKRWRDNAAPRGVHRALRAVNPKTIKVPRGPSGVRARGEGYRPRLSTSPKLPPPGSTGVPPKPRA